MSTSPETEVELLDEEIGDPDAESASPAPVAGDQSPPRQPVQLRKQPFTNEPYTFDHCTITVTLQFWPAGTDPRDRLVLVSVRNHQDIPLLAIVHSGELGQLPPVVSELLERLRVELPERERAHAEREAKRTPAANPPATPRKGKAAGKPASAPEPPKPPQAVPAPQPASTHEQLDLFSPTEGVKT
jgi:hypothetical protein